MVRVLLFIGMLYSSVFVHAQTPAAVMSVKLTSDRSTAYVDEQVLLTLEVQVSASAFSLTGTEPEVDGAEIVSIDKHTRTQELDGIQVNVVTTVYALFASTEASLSIPPQRFQAVLPVSSLNGDAAGNPVIMAESDPLTLKVIAAPVTADRLWFAAQDVALSAEWSVDSMQVEAGEPVNRVVKVKVQGQRVKAIPPLVMPASHGLRSYPGLPDLQSAIAPEGIGGVRIQTMTLVAPVSGIYAMPELTLDWWDITRREWRVATLPAAEFGFIESELSAAQMDRHRWLLHRRYYRVALAIACFVAIAGIAISALLWLRLTRTRGAQNVGRGGFARATGERHSWSLLQRQIKRGNAVSIRHALLQWADRHWPGEQVMRLEQIAEKCSENPHSILALDAEIYGCAQPHDRRALKVAVKTLRRKQRAKTHRLPPLYPGTSASQ